jgi:hypothetical protein
MMRQCIDMCVQEGSLKEGFLNLQWTIRAF